MSFLIFITGGASGIGRAVAQAMLGAGYAVTLVGRRAEALDETARVSGAPAERVLAAPTDITDPVAVRAVFERVRVRFGRLDVLVLNAVEKFMFAMVFCVMEIPSSNFARTPPTTTLLGEAAFITFCVMTVPAFLFAALAPPE